MAVVELYPQQQFAVGHYESAVVNIPYPCSSIQVNATRVGWAGDTNCLELYVMENYHPKGKWSMLIGFKARGTTRKPADVTWVRRKVKGRDWGQIKLVFDVYQPFISAISLEFT